MKRRGLLTAIGLHAAGLAGCLASAPFGSGDDGRPTEERHVPFGTAVTLGDETLKLANPRIRKAVMADFGIWQEVRCEDGQYLLVDATTSGSVPTRFGDIDLASMIDTGEFDEVELGVEGAPGEAPRDPSKWQQRTLAFEFPNDPGESASVRWRSDGDAAYWDLDQDLRDRLAVEPAFNLDGFEVSQAGDDVRLGLTVSNTGDRAGDFLGQVSYENVEDASSVLRLDVGSGGTTEYEGVPDILRGVAADHRVVTMRYSASETVGEIERALTDDGSNGS